MDACPLIKYIGIFATGTNNVDLAEASKRNITVKNVPGYSTTAVAQQVFSYILDFSNKIRTYNESVKKGDWIKSKSFSYFNFPTFELSSLTLGIIGFGNIGRRVAQIAHAFDMKVLVYTRQIPQDFENITFVDFSTLLKSSDIISLHCPLTDDTYNIINKDSLKLMKPQAVLINTARGPLVNEQDLRDALTNKQLAYAYLDVITVEPMEKSNLLKDIDNCIMTPHTAWAPRQTRQRLLDIAADNFKNYLQYKQEN